MGADLHHLHQDGPRSEAREHAGEADGGGGAWWPEASGDGRLEEGQEVKGWRKEEGGGRPRRVAGRGERTYGAALGRGGDARVEGAHGAKKEAVSDASEVLGSTEAVDENIVCFACENFKLYANQQSPTHFSHFVLFFSTHSEAPAARLPRQIRPAAHSGQIRGQSRPHRRQNPTCRPTSAGRRQSRQSRPCQARP